MDKKILTIAICSVLAVVLVTSIVMAAPPQCKDGTDNDGDGYIDWPDDPGCADKNDKTETNPDIECDDGTDNDGDSAIDMSDAGCSSPTDNDETNCGDGVCEGGETQLTCPEDCGYPTTTTTTIPDSCSDTDGGNVPTVFGTTSGYYNGEPYSNDDYCVNSSNVMEYYCSGDYEQSSQENCGTDGYIGDNYCLNSSVYRDYRDYYCYLGTCSYSDTPILQEECEYGCTNGTCDSPPDSCSDTDNGNYPFVFGITSGYYNGEPYSNDDYCVNSSNVMEYYCSGDYEQSSQQSCGTDGYGSPYCWTGDTIYKNYTDYFCAGGECDYDVTPTFQEDCDSYDGYVGDTYCNGSSVYRDYRDYHCYLGTCVYSDTPILQEECEYGCTNGTCDSPPDSCSDTDGGYVITVQGTVSGYSNGYPYEYDDYCFNTTVVEYYCSGDQWNSNPVDCTTQNLTTCTNGACV